MASNQIDSKKLIIATIASALISAVLNNLYFILYCKFTGFSLPDILNLGSISGASIFPSLLGGLVFFLLHKFTKKGDMIFIVLSLVLAIASLGGIFKSTLPNGMLTPSGFAMATVPMHLIPAIIAVILIPKYSK